VNIYEGGQSRIEVVSENDGFVEDLELDDSEEYRNVDEDDKF